MHAFSPKQPDLNWENPEVREGVYAMMNWWVDRGVDGFRMDVINMISKQPEMLGRSGLGRKYARGERFFVNGPRLEEFLAEMNEQVGLTERNLLTVGRCLGRPSSWPPVTDPARRELEHGLHLRARRAGPMPEGSKWD